MTNLGIEQTFHSLFMPHQINNNNFRQKRYIFYCVCFKNKAWFIWPIIIIIIYIIIFISNRSSLNSCLQIFHNEMILSTECENIIEMFTMSIIYFILLHNSKIKYFGMTMRHTLIVNQLVNNTYSTNPKLVSRSNEILNYIHRKYHEKNNKYIQEFYAPELPSILCNYNNNNKDTKIRMTSEPHKDKKKREAMKDAIAKQITRRINAMKRNKLMKIWKNMFENIKKDPLLKHAFEIESHGSGAIYMVYGFAKNIFKRVYGRGSDSDFKLHLYRNLSQIEWDRLRYHLTDACMKCYAQLKKTEFQTIKINNRHYTIQSKRWRIIFNYSKIGHQMIQYQDYKSLLYGLCNQNIEFPNYDYIENESTHSTTNFNLIRLMVCYKDNLTGEKYNAELLDLSLSTPGDSRYYSPKELIHHIKNDCITINGIHYPNFQAIIQDNKRLYNSARDMERRKKCEARIQVLNTILQKYWYKINIKQKTYPGQLPIAVEQYLNEL